MGEIVSMAEFRKKKARENHPASLVARGGIVYPTSTPYVLSPLREELEATQVELDVMTEALNAWPTPAPFFGPGGRDNQR